MRRFVRFAIVRETPVTACCYPFPFLWRRESAVSSIIKLCKCTIRLSR